MNANDSRNNHDRPVVFRLGTGGATFHVPRDLLDRYGASPAPDDVPTDAVTELVLDLPSELRLGGRRISSRAALQQTLRVLGEYAGADHTRYRFQQIEDACGSGCPLWAVAVAARALGCDELADVCDVKSVRRAEVRHLGMESFWFARQHGLAHLRRHSVLALVKSVAASEVRFDDVADAFLHLDDDVDLRPLLTALVQISVDSSPIFVTTFGAARSDEHRDDGDNGNADADWVIRFTDAARLQALQRTLARSAAWPPDLVQHAHRLLPRFRLGDALLGRSEAHWALFEIAVGIADRAVDQMRRRTEADRPRRPSAPTQTYFRRTVTGREASLNRIEE